MRRPVAAMCGIAFATMPFAAIAQDGRPPAAPTTASSTEPPVPPVAPTTPATPPPEAPSAQPGAAQVAPQATPPPPAGDEALKERVRILEERAAADENRAKEHVKDHWYDRIQLRGYTQFRYQRFAGHGALRSPNDRSLGADNGFLIRRARLILFGEAHPHLSIYLQPDFASVFTDVGNVAQLRDWYADVFLDKEKEFRFRVGQSKIPYGFENMQSSQNRLPLDRSDGLNTAVKDERDIGVFAYYAPANMRKLFKHLVESGLKGSGDYGLAGFGVYNGQTANQPEANEYRHFVARLAYAFEIGGQIMEVNAAAYGGMFRVKRGDKITVAPGASGDLKDMRAGGALILYPQPIGLQVEYNWGIGPELEGSQVLNRPLEGGYAMTMMKLGPTMPYVRGLCYDGGRKQDTNSPRHQIKELEAGIEWQVFKALELTASYAETKRQVDTKEASGRWVRLQLQFNY